MTEAQLATSLHDARALIDALIVASRTQNVSPMPARPARFSFGDVEVDLHYRRVTRAGREVSLTPREYELLVELARGGGAPVSVEHLVRTVWKGHISPESRTIAQHVAEVRSKLEPEPSRPQFLLTIRKFGYRLLGDWVTE
jgi:two-component system alkaline phosphatase synthesis response regulator PhoP